MPPTPARPMPKYNRDLIILILKRRTRPCRRPRPGLGQNTRERFNNSTTKEEDPPMPPTPARPRPKYNKDLIIIILKKKTRPCRRPRPGLGQNTIEI